MQRYNESIWDEIVNSEGFRDFAEVYDASYMELSEDSLALIANDPRWGPIVAAMDPELLEAETEAGRERWTQLRSGSWRPYVEKLFVDGATYAAMGVELSAWLRLTTLVADLLTDKLVESYISEPERLSRALRSMGHFFNHAMGVIGDTYVESREQELERVRQRFHRLSDSGLLGVLIAGFDGQISEANETVCNLLGRSKSEIVGTNWEEYTSDEHHARARAALADVETKGVATPFESAIHADGGAVVPVIIGVAKLSEDSWISFVLDDTPQRELQSFRARTALLEVENQRVQEANRLKSEFLANMSHELRTPLNAILGFAELLHDGHVPADSPEHIEFLGDILTSGRHLQQLINDILDLAKVEAGKLAFYPEEVELDVLVRDAIALLRTQAVEAGIDIDHEVQVSNAFIDPARFKQVLYNYLSNALKFADGGRVMIRVLPSAAHSFRLEVEDDGIGIRKDEQARLFREFEQLDSTTKKRHQGTGLGLALTRRLVEAQGGTVGVTSTWGEGSTFYATFPMHAMRGEAVRLPQSYPASPTAPTILVVEDDPRDSAVVVNTLLRAGYAVETAATGAQALTKCAKQAFDAITLDLLLPDTNGLEVLRELRGKGPNQDVPVVVITIVADANIVGGYPVEAVFPKPVDERTLLRALEQARVVPDRDRAVWVVDDDDAATKLMSMLLREMGFRCMAFTDPRSALEAARANPPLAVVLDLVMPNMDGFEFLGRFRELDECADTPVAIWTGKDLSADELEDLHASAQSVLRKGLSKNAELVEALSRTLKQVPARGDDAE